MFAVGSMHAPWTYMELSVSKFDDFLLLPSCLSLLLPSSVYTNVEIESLLTLLSPYSSIEQYFSYFPHNQLSLPLFSFHLHPITLPPRFPPASPSAILLPLFFFLMPL